MAAALGLDAADFDVGALPAERWSAGNPFTFVPLRGLDAMARCAVDLARFDRAFGERGRAAVYLFCRETRTAGHDFHARMFAPGMGMLEDPATGSAVAAFAGYLAAHGGYADGEHIIRIEQGYEMGRPSLIELTTAIAGGRLTGASIAGSAVVVLEGTIDAWSRRADELT
jgi:trans-2,3-dihydro-3-hydroxyanthranilate isomerase